MWCVLGEAFSPKARKAAAFLLDEVAVSHHGTGPPV